MNIPLLADKNQSVSRAYGVLKEDEGISFRGLFIIDGNSKLRQVSGRVLLEFVIIFLDHLILHLKLQVRALRCGGLPSSMCG